MKDGLQLSLPSLDKYLANRKEEKRPDLVKMFHEKTGYAYGHLGTKLKGMDLEDLRYLRSRCNSEFREGRKESFKHAFDAEMLRIWGAKEWNGLV